MAQDPISQQYIATGGGDSLGKLWQQLHVHISYSSCLDAPCICGVLAYLRNTWAVIKLSVLTHSYACTLCS